MVLLRFSDGFLAILVIGECDWLAEPFEGEAVEFLLVGPVRLRCGGAVRGVGVRKRRFVLALLALEANRPVPVDRLIDLLWPDGPPAGARGVIHGHISGLRATLAAIGPEREGVSLRRQGAAYVLACDSGQVDAQRFIMLGGPAVAESNPEVRLGLLDEALSLWRGPALADAAPEPVRGRLTRHLDEARLTTIEHCLDTLVELGRYDAAIGGLIELADQH